MMNNIDYYLSSYALRSIDCNIRIFPFLKTSMHELGGAGWVCRVTQNTMSKQAKVRFYDEDNSKRTFTVHTCRRLKNSDIGELIDAISNAGITLRGLPGVKAYCESAMASSYCNEIEAAQKRLHAEKAKHELEIAKMQAELDSANARLESTVDVGDEEGILLKIAEATRRRAAAVNSEVGKSATEVVAEFEFTACA